MNVPRAGGEATDERLKSLVVTAVRSSPLGLVPSKVALSALIRSRFGDLSDAQEQWLLRSITAMTDSPIPGVLVMRLEREGRPFVFADAERWTDRDWPRIRRVLAKRLSYGSPEERRHVLEDPLRDWCRDNGWSVWGKLPGLTSDFVLRVDGLSGINVEVRNRRGELLNHLSQVDREIFGKAARAGVVTVVVTGRVTAKYRESVTALTSGLCVILETASYVVSSQLVAAGLEEIGMPVPVVVLEEDRLPAEITTRFAAALEEAASMVRAYRQAHGLPAGVEPSPDSAPAPDAVGAATPGRALRSARHASVVLREAAEIVRMVEADATLTRADVAAALGVSVETVGRRLRQAGLPSPWSRGRPSASSRAPINSVTKLGSPALRAGDGERQASSDAPRVHGDASLTNDPHDDIAWWLAELDLLDPGPDEAIVVKSDGTSFLAKATPPPSPRYMGRWAPPEH